MRWLFFSRARPGGSTTHERVSHPSPSERRVRLAAAVACDAGRPPIDAPVAEASEAVILVTDHQELAVGGPVKEIECGPLIVGEQLPSPLAAVVRRLEAIEIGNAGFDAPPAAIRMTTRSGALVTVHAARLRDASGSGPIVVTIAPATPAERSSLLLAPHGLTPQCRLAKLVLQGRTSGQIVVELCISANTAQDHPKGGVRQGRPAQPTRARQRLDAPVALNESVRRRTSRSLPVIRTWHIGVQTTRGLPDSSAGLDSSDQPKPAVNAETFGSE
jgi:DNA-binding CsgD family transcriptional regulator